MQARAAAVRFLAYTLRGFLNPPEYIPTRVDSMYLPS